MSESQYQKRLKKNKAPAADVTVDENDVLTIAAPVLGDNTNISYDVFFDASDRKHKAAVVEYDPVTRASTVIDIVPISRQVGLQFANHKLALETILKRKNK